MKLLLKTYSKMQIKLKVIISLLFLSFTFNAMSQDTIIDITGDIYNSIEEALQNPDKVEILVLKRKGYKEFPKEIFQFKRLKYLDLSKNKITFIPKEISSLIYLEKLDVSQNKLISLPDEIGNLISLKELILNRNEIETLPPTIGNLVNLIRIDMWGNEVSSMPKELNNLKNNLKFFDLRVIQIKDYLQAEIEQLLPNTKIYFSFYCNCN